MSRDSVAVRVVGFAANRTANRTGVGGQACRVVDVILN